MSRCDSAAIVSNTRELFPDPDTPVNTVSRRLGSSTLTSLRLFSRAPWTRIMSWLSATLRPTGCARVLAGMVIVFSGVAGRRSAVLKQTENVAVGVGDGCYEAAATDVAHGVFYIGAGLGHLGELRLDVRHM